MNCDRIAPCYEWLEKAAFGRRLQNHRVEFLRAAEKSCRVLVLGDGDGRFTHALVSRYPSLEIDCVEVSAGMVKEIKKRVLSSPSVHIIQADLFDLELDERLYDVVFTHFFLDCFSSEKVSKLVLRVSKALALNAVWIVSDFKQAKSGWRTAYSRAWLAAMYFFFHLATGLETRRLPEYSSKLETAGFTKRRETISMDGLIASEWWQR